MRADSAEAPGTATARRVALAGNRRRIRPARARILPRYTNFVGFLKLVLPSVAALLMIVIAVWPQINPRNNALPLGFASISAKELADLSMINARYTGIDGRNQPFTVFADVARELGDKSDLVALESPKADVTLADGTWIALTAAVGTFRRLEQIIDLTGEVNLFHDAGYEFRTNSAQMDLQAGTAFGFDPVAGHGPFGTVSSEGFLILDRGSRVVFTGKARMVLYPASSKAGVP